MSDQEFGARIRATDETGGAIRSAQSNIAGLVTSISTGFLAIRQLLNDVTGAIVRVVAEADNFKRLSNQTNLSVEAVDRLSFVAESAESDIQSLARAMDYMARGATEGKKVFDDLGLSTRHFAQSDNEQKFFAVAEALRQIEDNGKRAQAAFEIFGRSNLEIRGILNLTTEELNSATDAARGFGSMSEATVERLDEADYKWAVLSRRIHGVVLAFADYIASGFIAYSVTEERRVAGLTKAWNAYADAVTRQNNALLAQAGVSPLMHIPPTTPPVFAVPRQRLPTVEDFTVEPFRASDQARAGRMAFFKADQQGAFDAVRLSDDFFQKAAHAAPQLQLGIPVVTEFIDRLAHGAPDYRDAVDALAEHQERTRRLGAEFGANVVDAGFRAADSWSYFATQAITTGQGVFEALGMAAKQFFYSVLTSLFQKGINEITGSLISTIIKGGIKFLAHGAGGEQVDAVVGRTLAVRIPQLAVAGDRVATLNITVNAGFGTRGEGVQAARAIASYLAEAGVL